MGPCKNYRRNHGAIYYTRKQLGPYLLHPETAIGPDLLHPETASA